jgi:hypothetical protein
MEIFSYIKNPILHLSGFGKQFREIICYYDLTFIRLFIALCEITFGLLLLVPGETTNSIDYKIISSFISEEVLGTIFLLQGLITTWIVVKNHRSYYGFFIESIVGTFIWLFTATTIFFSLYPPPNRPGIYIIALFSWIVLARYKVK